MEKSVREEQAQFASFLRSEIASEMKALEDFRRAIERKRVIGGCIRLEFLDGSVAEYGIRSTDDPQHTLDFVSAVCSRRTKDLQGTLNYFDEKKDDQTESGGHQERP